MKRNELLADFKKKKKKDKSRCRCAQGVQNPAGFFEGGIEDFKGLVRGNQVGGGSGGLESR